MSLFYVLNCLEIIGRILCASVRAALAHDPELELEFKLNNFNNKSHILYSIKYFIKRKVLTK